MEQKQNDYESLIKAIEEFSKELKKQSGEDYSRISTKDVLFFCISKFTELDERVDILEKESAANKAIVNLLKWGTPIAVTICIAIGVIGV